METLHPSISSSSNVSIQMSGVQTQVERGFFRNKTSKYVQLSIKDTISNKQYDITLKAQDESQMVRTAQRIKQEIQLSRLTNTGEVMWIVSRSITGLDESKKAVRLSKLFSKCLGKEKTQTEIQYQKNLKNLQTIDKYKNIELQKKQNETARMKDLEKIIKELKKNPQSKKAWGRFYAKMELFDNPEGIQLLDQKKGDVQELLGKGVALAKSYKTTHTQVKGDDLDRVSIEVTDQKSKTVRLAHQMEEKFIKILGKLDERPSN